MLRVHSKFEISYQEVLGKEEPGLVNEAPGPVISKIVVGNWTSTIESMMQIIHKAFNSLSSCT
jgi:hypothetical protein